MTATTTVAFEFPATTRELRTEAIGDTVAVSTTTAARERWPWMLAALAFGHSALLGVWLMEVRGYAIGDAVSRTSTARIIVRSSDPHLSAWGFYWMPIPTVARVPFVLLLEPFGLTHLAGALTSALFLALTIPVLAATARVLEIPRWIGVTVCVLYAANPIALWSGATGMSETTFGFFAAIVLYGVCRFSRDRSSRSIMVIGLALGGCMGCRFETLALAPVLALTVGFVAGRERWRSAAAMVAIPSMVVFVLWTVASKLIQGEWFHWYSVAQTLGTPPDGAAWLPTERTIVTSSVLSLERITAMAPAVIALLIALVLPHRARRTTLVLASVTWVLPAAVTLQLVQGSTYGTPRYFYHLVLFGAVGVLWLWSNRDDHASMRAIAVASLGALAVSIPVGVMYLADADTTHVEKEHLLMRAMLGREPVAIDRATGDDAGSLPEYQRLADLIDERLGADGRIAMDTLDAVAFLYSDKPKQFILPEDRDSLQILSDPEGRFDLALVRDGRATAQGELLRQIVEGDPRWVLIEDFGSPGRLYEFDAGDDLAGSTASP